MTDPLAVVERLMGEVEEITVEIEGHHTELKTLYDRRTDLFIKLAALPGVTHRMIAERAHVTKDAVSVAIFSARKKARAADERTGSG